MFTTKRMFVETDRLGQPVAAWVEWRDLGERVQGAQVRFGPFDTPQEVLALCVSAEPLQGELGLVY